MHAYCVPVCMIIIELYFKLNVLSSLCNLYTLAMGIYTAQRYDTMETNTIRTRS